MCGGGGGDDKALKYQIRQEKERKERIDEGDIALQQLFAPLEGGSYQLTNPAVAGITRDEYIARELANWKPPAAEGSGFVRGLANNINNVFLQENQQAKLKEKLGNDYDALLRDPDSYSLTEGTGTPIWDTHRQAYLDFANPQLDRSFGDARENLTYALSRSGQTQGSVAGERRAELETDYGLEQQNVAQTAQSYGNQAKSDLATQKQSLYQMLNSTANPGATADAARSALASIRSTPALTPLGTLFQNATAGLAGAVPAYQQGQQVGAVNNIIYSRDPDRGSGRVVR